MDIKILVFDIDGTLIDRTKQHVEESAIQAIAMAKEKGYDVMIATGRSFFFIHDDVRKRVNSDYYVSVNGAILNDEHGQVLTSHGFNRHLNRKLIELARKNGHPLGVKYHNHIGVYGDFNEFVSQYVGFDHPRVSYLHEDNDLKDAEQCEAVGAFCFAPHLEMALYRDTIPELAFVRAQEGAFEVTAQGINKTKTIEEYLHAHNLTWDNVMAFGDADNDIEMLMKAKIGVAMGNATDSVKQIADFVTTPILEDGIAHALRHFDIVS